MNTEENPTPQTGPTTHVTAPRSGSVGAAPAWGAPPPAAAGPVETPTQVEVRPHWPARKVIGAVVIAAVIVGGGTAVAIAATAPSTPTATTPTSSGSGSSGYLGHSRSGRGGYGGSTYSALGNAVHGDFVVRTSTGGYATERLQTGTVTEVDSTSISLTSTDGYQSRYAVGTSTLINRGYTKIAQVHKGDTVTIVATLSGNTATATGLTDSKDLPTTRPSGSGGSSDGTAPGGGMQPNDAPPSP